MIWISISFAWTPARSRSRMLHIALNIFCWSLLVAMISNRSPSRDLGPLSASSFRPVPPPACLPSRSVVPSFVSPRSSCRGRGVGRCGVRGWSIGRASVTVVCLVGAGLVFSCLVVGLSVPLYQFPVRFPMLGWRFQGILCCLPRVRFRPILCVSVRSCASSSRLLISLRREEWRPVSRPVCLVGGAVRRHDGCLLSRARCGWRFGCHVPVPVAVRLPTPCRSVRTMSDEIRLWVAAECYRVSAVACLPFRLAPLFDKGGRGGRRNE